jgi:calcineurin-like phosphoesterase family protein
MRYFTADLHLGDKTIASWRGFEGVRGIAEHDALIIARLNECVGADDELWILGDICKARVDDVEALRDAIVCRRVHILVGNHDSRSKFVTCGRFASVDYYGQIGRVRKDGYKFVMSHYPMLDWDRAYHGSYMLHGHIHSLPLEPSGPMRPQASGEGGIGMRGYNARCAAQGIRRFDVGLDANGYRPVSAEQIVAALPSDEEWSAIHGLSVD